MRHQNVQKVSYVKTVIKYFLKQCSIKIYLNILSTFSVHLFRPKKENYLVKTYRYNICEKVLYVLKDKYMF